MKTLLLLKAEVKRTILMFRRYPLEVITGLITLYAFFMVFFLAGKFLAGGMMGGSPLSFGRTVSGMILGYAMWNFAILALSDMTWNISNEAQTGTLEQLYMLPPGPVKIFLARFLADLLPNLIIMTVLLYALMLSTGVRISIPALPALAVLLVTIMGLYGFGFILGGLSLIYKRIGQTANILQFILLFLALTPVEKLPRFLQAVAATLPLAQGVKVMKLVAVDGIGLADPAITADLGVLILNSAAYLLAGIGIFRMMDNVARDKGLLGHY